MRPHRAVAALLVAALPACTIGVRRSSERSASPRPSVSVSVPPCRPTYAPPDPNRPRIALTFDVDASHARVTGTERVRFTPDRPITEVVFRLWPNGVESAPRGARLDVTRASLPTRTESRGAPPGDPGTLLALRLPAPSPAGRAVSVSLDFTLALPPSSTDRWGHTVRTAWWASGHPLLAWVRGAGWATEPASALLAETATSEVADYDVTVTAPAADTVLGNALTDPPVDVAGGRRRWHFANPTARDVGVAVGPFSVRRTTIGTLPAVVAVSDELARGTDAERVFGPVTANAVESLQAYRTRFGPFPFASLTLVAIDAIGRAGIEYPGLVFLGSSRYDVVVPHEIGHQWFYGLVGDDQARDPWLDEAFATYAESFVNVASARRYLAFAGVTSMGRPMSYWDKHRDDYSTDVYAGGAGVLLTARATNDRLFDALLRCYVATNAYRVATPADVATALAPLREAVSILRTAGALP